MIDDYDININQLKNIKDKELLKIEYSHNLTRMLNFEKFMNEKFMFLVFSTISTIVAFTFVEIFQENNSAYLNLLPYGLLVISILFLVSLFILYRFNKYLKKRKLKIIELLKEKN